MTSGKDKMRMSYAVYRLCTPKSIKHADRYSSKTYEKFRESLSKNISGANSCHYGVPKSEVTKSRIRETRQAKGYTTPEKNGMYKRNHTTEAKQKMSETKKTNNFGQTQKFHIDFQTNDVWTFVLFTEENWNTQWGGEFVCFDGINKEYKYTPYVPNTGALIPSNWEHYGASPNECTGNLRTTMAFSYTSLQSYDYIKDLPVVKSFYK